jgi:hypothetical protein
MYFTVLSVSVKHITDLAFLLDIKHVTCSDMNVLLHKLQIVQSQFILIKYTFLTVSL